MDIYHEIIAKALKGTLDEENDLKILDDLYLSYGRPKDPWSLEEILTLVHRFPLAISKALLAHCKTDWYHLGPEMVCTRIYPLPCQKTQKAFWEGNCTQGQHPTPIRCFPING